MNTTPNCPSVPTIFEYLTIAFGDRLKPGKPTCMSSRGDTIATDCTGHTYTDVSLRTPRGARSNFTPEKVIVEVDGDWRRNTRRAALAITVNMVGPGWESRLAAAVEKALDFLKNWHARKLQQAATRAEGEAETRAFMTRLNDTLTTYGLPRAHDAVQDGFTRKPKGVRLEFDITGDDKTVARKIREIYHALNS